MLEQTGFEPVNPEEKKMQRRRYTGRHFMKSLLWIAAVMGGSSPGSGETVSLETAIARAVAGDPGLERIEWEMEAAAGRVEQARSRPNPVIGAEVENLLGSGEFSGTRQLELTWSLRQEIETSGKREKRSRLAQREEELVDWSRNERRRALEAKVRDCFVQGLLAQEQFSLLERQWQIARGERAEAVRLADAGALSEVVRGRAEIRAQRAALSMARAEQELQRQRAELASLWGEPGAPPFTLVGELDLPEALPELSVFLEKLSESGVLARFSAEREARKAELVLERAQARPNIELFGGARYSNEGDGDASLVFGVEMPWPLHDRNEGNIRSARARLRSLPSEEESLRRELERALIAAYWQMRTSHEEATTLRDEILPAAEALAEVMESGYARGEYDFMSVAEVRREWVDARALELEALGRFALARSQIDSLLRPAKETRREFSE